MQMSRITLKDVAKQVGVHPSTVSRVLNPATRGMVSDAIAEKVLEAADELGYSVNPFALGLKTQRSLTIGVLIPDLTNPVFPPMIRGIEHGLANAGYTAILADSDNHVGDERLLIERFKARQVDGLILATAHLNDEMVASVFEEGDPIVLLNRQAVDGSVPSITNDDNAGIQMVVEHIVGLGHRRIAHVAGPQDLSTGHSRYLAFQGALQAHGLIPDPKLIGICRSFTEAEGQRVLGELLDSGEDFTAVVAGNDLLALGCYDAIEERGLRCPEDISVTGFNNMPFVDKFKPPMTTVKIALFEMGQKAAEMILDVINDREIELPNIELTPELVVRGSTAPPAN